MGRFQQRGCVFRFTCQTKGSSRSVSRVVRQTLRVIVCEKQVIPLAIMAPLMEKGSMVYTTNTIKRKKETWKRENKSR